MSNILYPDISTNKQQYINISISTDATKVEVDEHFQLQNVLLVIFTNKIKPQQGGRSFHNNNAITYLLLVNKLY